MKLFVATLLLALSLSCFTDAAWVRIIQGIPEVKQANAYLEQVRIMENLTFTQIPPYFFVPDGMHTFWFDLTPQANFNMSSLGNMSFWFGQSASGSFNSGSQGTNMDFNAEAGANLPFNPNLYRNFTSGKLLPFIPFTALLFPDASYTLVLAGSLVNFGISINMFTDTVSAVTGNCQIGSTGGATTITNSNITSGSGTTSNNNNNNLLLGQTGTSQLIITNSGLVSTKTSTAGFLRLINLDKDADSAVLYVNGKLATVASVGFMDTSKYIDLGTLGLTFGGVHSIQVSIGQGNNISSQSVNLTQRDTNNLWTVFLFSEAFQSSSGPTAKTNDDYIEKTENVLVRFVHAWPELPAIDIVVDGKVIMKNISFSTITPYFLTIRGIHQFRIVGSGTGMDLTSQFSAGLNTTDVDLFTFYEFISWNQTYTFALIRPTLRSQLFYQFGPSVYLWGPNHMTAHKMFVDILLNPLSSGKSALRIVDLAADAGEKFVELSASGSTNASQTQSTILTFPDSTPYLTLNPGQYTANITVFPQNQTNGLGTHINAADVHDVYNMQSSLQLAANIIYSMFFFDSSTYTTTASEKLTVKTVVDFPASYSHWRAQVLQF